MKSDDILLSLFPIELQPIIKKNDYDLLLEKFMNLDISDEKLAYLVSLYAEKINTVDSHYMAINLFNFHFNYLSDAYEMAFYHHWRVLELTKFLNKVELSIFIGLPFEPDFDIIPNEYIEFAKEKLNLLK